MYLPSRMTMRLIAGAAILIIAAIMQSPLGAKLAALQTNIAG